MEKSALGFDEVKDGLVQFLSAPVEGLDREAFLAHGAMIEHLGRLLDSGRVRFAGELAFQSRKELGEEGLSRSENCKTPANLLSAVTGVSTSEANKRLALGLRLRRAEQLGGIPGAEPFPLVSEALASGAISVESAATITKMCSELRSRGVAHDSLMDAEKVLTEFAQLATSTADTVVVVGTRLRHQVDPDGGEPRRETQERRRSLSISHTADGMYRVAGLLTPEQAAMWVSAARAIISPRTGPRFVSDQERSDEEALADERTSPQKMADAVTELIARAAGAPEMPKLAGATTTVTVHVSLAELKAGHGVGWVDGIVEPLAPSVVEQLRCNSPIVATVLGDNGKVLHLAKTKRLFSSSQLKALAARDGGCITPGCDAPVSACEAHHVIPWQSPEYAPGRTDIDNGVLLCRFHHARLHKWSWKITMIDRVPHLIPPSFRDPTRTPIPTTKRRTGVGLSPGSFPTPPPSEHRPWLSQRQAAPPSGETAA
ncbi:MAG: HNH endonuclease [Herbiconiux sp.]|uniref:HNH endonuclease signature motif containing protein n=1 Tax=Herbiconiux sp. TaxID=1871186 RepID=UPI0011F46EB4|nr:HNH endonuclease signature motif containing protein [Herbiconiux sp.]TAJ50252.1 MAG: HNH endonuclease [Herbiconiux sp.]